jgi:hypothetical protein
MTRSGCSKIAVIFARLRSIVTLGQLQQKQARDGDEKRAFPLTSRLDQGRSGTAARRNQPPRA